jgi:3-hydroxyisobutyrate dehydrogenase-like beta-hydroxyacid dehydrogenase
MISDTLRIESLDQSNELPSIAFLGLSSLGSTIAARLAQAGYPMSVYDDDQRKTLMWVQRYGGIAASNPSEAASESKYVITCALDENEVRKLLVAHEGAVHGMRTGTTVIDHSAVSQKGAIGLRVLCEANGMHYLDAAPVGGPPDAERGKLTLFVGGNESKYLELLPIFGHYAASAVRLGGVSSGTRGRMAYQSSVQHAIAAVADLAQKSEKLELDRDALIEGATHALTQQLPEIVRLIDYEEKLLAKR